MQWNIPEGMQNYLKCLVFNKYFIWVQEKAEIFYVCYYNTKELHCNNKNFNSNFSPETKDQTKKSQMTEYPIPYIQIEYVLI